MTVPDAAASSMPAAVAPSSCSWPTAAVLLLKAWCLHGLIHPTCIRLQHYSMPYRNAAVRQQQEWPKALDL